MTSSQLQLAIARFLGGRWRSATWPFAGWKGPFAPFSWWCCRIDRK